MEASRKYLGKKDRKISTHQGFGTEKGCKEISLEQPGRPEAEEGADSQLPELADRVSYFLEGVIQTTLKNCDLATGRRAQMGLN